MSRCLRNSVRLRTCTGRRAIKFLGSASSATVPVLHDYCCCIGTFANMSTKIGDKEVKVLRPFLTVVGFLRSPPAKITLGELAPSPLGVIASLPYKSLVCNRCELDFKFQPLAHFLGLLGVKPLVIVDNELYQHNESAENVFPSRYCGERYGCGDRGSRGWAEFAVPSLDLTPFRPWPLSRYLAGTVAKGVGVAKLVQRLGWLRGTQLGLNSFSPPAVVTVPCGYCGEGRGCGERGTEAGLAPRPASFEATHFRPKPLSPYLAGTVAKGVGVAKGVQKLGWLRGPGLDLTPFLLQPLSPYLAGTLAKGVGVAKGVQRLGRLRIPQAWKQLIFAPSPCRRTFRVLWRRVWVWRKGSRG
ncbi:hypothetical protein [Oryza sativa Japonica Group]|uniref:Uncharacterized protein P0460H02.23 n=1 Tax=Oryza sativa subsp. japonica TaxID=39947 RepID=Q5ZC25_ORYSJ|nr:hypothetical protein [Oryza sativa Japonica Group]